MKAKATSTIFLFLLFAISTFAQSTFSANSSDMRNQATFESNAPMEDIIGVSNKLDIMVMINTNDITKMPKGKVDVDLVSLKTGIELRDEHLRSPNWLDTEKFPKAKFMLTGISAASSNMLADTKKVTATGHGKFTVHGVTKGISVPMELTYYKENKITKGKMPGNLLKVKANFSIELGDYGVKIPGMVVGKLNETIKVSVNFMASDAGGGMNPCNPCNPCGVKKSMKNPCNPCGVKKMMKKVNPCNPCNPMK
ncbi:MAG: YceI family protein [Melioribacteraceae bacterium]